MNKNQTDRDVMQQAQDTIRFCPECGSLGEVKAGARDCCPDGSHAAYMPVKTAERCRNLFRAALAAPQPVPTFDHAKAANAALREAMDRAIALFGEANVAKMLLAPQPAPEPVHFRAVLDAEQVPQQLKTSMHVVGFRTWKAADEFVASERDMKGWRYTIEPLCICQHGITKGPAA